MTGLTSKKNGPYTIQWVNQNSILSNNVTKLTNTTNDWRKNPMFDPKIVDQLLNSDEVVKTSDNNQYNYTSVGNSTIVIQGKPHIFGLPQTHTKEPQSNKTTNQQDTTSQTTSSSSWMADAVHAITTPKSYSASRDCGLRPLDNGKLSMTQTGKELVHDILSGDINLRGKRRGRIVGGRDSKLGEFPWTVMIRESSLLGIFYKTKCGGVLIDLKWVLTAAHCQPKMFGSLVAIIGEHSDMMVPIGNQSGAYYNKKVFLRPAVRKVRRMIVHRDYNYVNFDNDIALLELESPFTLEPHVVPICLPNNDEDFDGRQGTVAGWGKISYSSHALPEVMQVAQLPVMSNKRCMQMYEASGHLKLISDSFLCAGLKAGGSDSCDGDSGSPLQVQREDGRWVLAGTVSHGIKCAEPNLPGIYIRTSAYLAWIKAVMHHQEINKRYGPSLLN